MNPTRPTLILAAVAAALTLACGSEGASPASTGDVPAPAATVAASADGAVRVPKGYQPPADRVPSTGATIPVNGKPTLVYVDAIW